MKNNKRSRCKYPGLEKQTTLKIRADLVDQDYIAKLNDEEKQWLSNFNEEWINANLNHKGKKFHKKPKDKKRIYDMNNSRNRDAYGKAKIAGKLDTELSNTGGVYHPEEDIIDRIDSVNEIENLFKEIEDKK